MKSLAIVDGLPECRFRFESYAAAGWFRCVHPDIPGTPRHICPSVCETCKVAEVGEAHQVPLPKGVPGGPPIQPDYGPGTELKKLLAELGLQPSSGCECEARARQMNAWGPDGCREHRAEIITWLKEEADKAGWVQKVAVFWKVKGCPWFSPLADPFGSLVDEAIRRSALPPKDEKKGPGDGQQHEAQG